MLWNLGKIRFCDAPYASCAVPDRRQCDRERSSRAGLADHRDTAAVSRHNLTNECEAKAGAACLSLRAGSAMERLENMWQVVI